MTDIVEVASGEIQIIEVASGSVEIIEVAIQGPPGINGPTDHGALTGLSDDDHVLYHTDARGDARYSPLAHAHAGIYEPANANLQSHISSTANPHSVTAAQSGADATGTAAGLLSTHESGSGVHSIAGVTGLQTALDGKSATSHDHAATYAPIAQGVTNGDSHDHSGGDGAQIAYSGLSGLPTLGTAAATAATDYATAAQGATADTAVQPGDDAADLGSGSATDGYVLTADGVGGSAWEATAVTYAGAASEIHAATEKTTPVDADELGLVDSAASWVLKKLSWANVKATLAGVFLLLAGKSGGQTLIGGTGVTDKLVLQGTSGNGTSTATALEVKVGDNGLVTGLSVDNTGILTVNSGINFSQVTAPTAPELTILAVAGNVPVGLHRYLVTYVTNIGETQRGGVSTVTIVSGSQQVQMTVPVSTDSRVKSRYLYRDDNNYVFKRIAILADNTTTNYIDNNASGDTNNNIWYSPNTTNKIFVYNGTSKILVADSSVTSLGEGALAAAGLSVINTVAVGANAGKKMTTGSSNTHLGYNAGSGVTIGSNGCFVGSYAGGVTHDTSNDTFIGHSAGNNYTGSISGSENVSIGSQSGGGGSGNFSLGNTASNKCVVIGRHAGFASTTTMTNSIAIGYDCLVDKSNQAILGNSSITETILRGTVYITKTTEQLRLGYDATNYVSATVSAAGNLTFDTTGGTIYTPDTIENTVNGGGVVLRSPNGTRYMITVTDAGALSVSAA